MQSLPKSQIGTKYLFSYVKEVNGENFQNLYLLLDFHDILYAGVGRQLMNSEN